MDTRELLDKMGENLSVRRSFGAAIEREGALIIPVALVAVVVRVRSNKRTRRALRTPMKTWVRKSPHLTSNSPRAREEDSEASYFPSAFTS